MAITVTALHTTPVKSLRIRSVDSIELTVEGAVGDRAFYVVGEDGAMINGKRLGTLQTVLADYDHGTRALALCLADGERVSAEVRLGPEVATTFFGADRRARVLDGPWAAALTRQLGHPLRLVCDRSAVDRGAEGAISLVSRASLTRLAEVDHPRRDVPEVDAPGDPEPGVDPRRFRMLIEIDGVDSHAEDGWIGREIALGEARVRLRGHIGRCVTTTRSPDSGEVDFPTLQMLATYRREEPTTEPLAFGVHGEVLAPGTVRVGDPVTPGPWQTR